MVMCFQRESVAHIPLTSGPHWVLRPPGALSVATSLRQPLSAHKVHGQSLG